MVNLSFNELSSFSIQTGSYFDGFRNISGEKKVKVWTSTEFSYVCFLKNTQLDLTLSLESVGVRGEVFIFVPVVFEHTTLNFIAEVLSSDVEIAVTIISLQKDQSHLTINGEIKVWEHLQDVKAVLKEETYCIWQDLKSQMKPALFVSSYQVKTSHWTKIQRIPNETLFYLQSRGLSLERAENFFVENLLESVLNPLHLSEKEKEDIQNFIQ